MTRFFFSCFEMTRDLGRRLILTTSELNRARNELVRNGDE